MNERRLEHRALRPTSFDEGLALARAQSGDEQAFAQLVRRYGQPVLSLCYASVLNPADAEDLAQDVFFAAWRGLRRFRRDSAFATWLFALARNRCIDHSRRARLRPRLLGEGESEATVRAAELDHSARRTAAAILDAAALLPLPLRQALLLRDVQGLSYQEIAELQAVPVGTVRSRIATARASVSSRVTE